MTVRQRRNTAADRAPSVKPASSKSSAQTPAEAAAAAAAAVASPPRGAMSAADIRQVFFGLMLVVFLAALNQTIIATALPTIGRTFHDFENLSWVVTAYLLTSTAVAPLYGKLSDLFGRRTMILVAIGLFMAGSAAAAAAPESEAPVEAARYPNDALIEGARALLSAIASSNSRSRGRHASITPSRYSSSSSA